MFFMAPGPGLSDRKRCFNSPALYQANNDKWSKQCFSMKVCSYSGASNTRPPPTCAVWVWRVVWRHKCRNNSKISTNIPTIPPLSRITMSICCLGSHGMEKSYLIFIAFIDSLISAHSPWEWEAGVCVMIWLLLALTLLFVQPLNFYTLPMYIPHVWWQCNYMYVTRIIQSMELMRHKMSTKSILLLCCCYISDVSFPQWRMTGCCWLAVCRSLALSEGKQTPRNLSKQPRVTQDNVGSLACHCTVGKHVDIELKTCHTSHCLQCS